MDMFNNYKNLDPDYIPNNEQKFIPCKHNNIVAGGTSTLVFELPAYYNEGLQKISVIFNQEERLIMVKNPSSIVVDEQHLFVECKLNTTESYEFGKTNLDTLVQLKLEYSDRTIYTEIEKLTVIEVLDNEGPAPDIPVMLGFGYTED